MSEPGPVIFGGRYELHRRLARGGMADVYLARDQLLDRPVAVKVLFAQYAADPAFVERFRREAQSAANLSHPNIVGVYDWGEESGTYYIVMEYVAGRSLADVLRQEGTLLPERAADIGIDIAAALGFAHRNGVVHRDVKPGNVLLSSDGQVKVADFGIARAISASDENLTQTGLVMGTATYFSPEQAQGRAVDPRSDVYSLGIVLYEMVCGSPPFRGDDALSVAYQHVQEPPTPPRQRNGALDPTFEAIILKCLGKTTGSRYPSAEDLRADLRRYREGHSIVGETVVAAPVTVAEPPTRAVPVTGATRIEPAATGAYYGEYAPETYETYVEPPRRNGVFIAVMLLLLGVIAVLLYVLADSLGIIGEDDDVETGELVAVPDVVGETLDGATTTLEALGFEVTHTFERNAEVEDGIVFDQDPDAQAQLAQGGTVALRVSEGEELLPVPNVVNLSETDARRTLNDAGFTQITVNLVSDDDVPEGDVVEQNPRAGEEAPASATITLSVSQGAAERVVQDVAGKTVDEARAILENQGFQVAITNESSDTVPEGVVIRTDPGAGTVQEEGATITMVVSAGVAEVTVPDVTEKTEETARQQLETAGFAVEVVEQALPPGDPKNGRVISQDPQGGTSAPKGSTVTITVGRATPVTTTTA